MTNAALSFVIILLIAGCSSKPAIQSNSLKMQIDKGSLLTHFKTISSAKSVGRKVGTIGSAYTQRYLVNQLIRVNILPYKNKYTHEFEISSSLFAKKVIGKNIVGEIKGSKFPHEYIVLTAHYDHLGKIGRKVYYGADDNASGTAALLSIAKILRLTPLERSVIILFTDGEEANLKGSYAFTEQNKELLAHIKLNVNLDMISGSTHSKRLRYFSKNLSTLFSESQVTRFKNSLKYKELKITKGFKNSTGQLNKKITWVKASDHYAFHRHGIPIIYFGVGTHKNYHTPKDKYENTNHQLLYYSTNAILGNIQLLDSMIN